MAKVPGSGAEGARFKSRYDLIENHLTVTLIALNSSVLLLDVKTSKQGSEPFSSPQNILINSEKEVAVSQKT